MKTKRYIVFLMIIFITAFGALCGCGEEEKPAPQPGSSSGEEIKVTESMNLSIGETKLLTAEYSPSGRTVDWTSSDSKIAAVDSTGNVRGVSIGQAKITASIGEYVKAYCIVSVRQTLTPVYSVEIFRSATQVYVGETFTLGAELTYGDEVLPVEMLLWSSSNEAVATVDNGQVEPVSYGTAEIKAEFYYEGVKLASAKCDLSVIEYYEMTLDCGEEVSCYPGESFEIMPKVYDKHGNLLSVSRSEIEYDSENEEIVYYLGGEYHAEASGLVRVNMSYRGTGISCNVRVWGLSDVGFVKVSGGEGTAVTQVLNKGFVYTGSGANNNVSINNVVWSNFLVEARNRGYTRLTIKIYSADGNVALRPNNTQNTLFTVPDGAFITNGDCSYANPYVGTKTLDDCKNLTGLLLGMIGDGTFEFTVTPE